jgi:hypothetical protein
LPHRRVVGMSSSTSWAHPDALRLRNLMTGAPPDPTGWMDRDTLHGFAGMYAGMAVDLLRRQVPDGGAFAAMSEDELAGLIVVTFREAFTLGVQFQAAGGHREP